MSREGGHTIQGRDTIQDRHTCGDATYGIRDTKGDKMSGRQTHHPTQHPTQAQMWGSNWRQDLVKVDSPSNTGTHAGRHWETTEDKGKEGLRKANAPSKAETPSNTGTHVVSRGEGRQEGRRGKTIEQGKQDVGKADTPPTTGAHAGR